MKYGKYPLRKRRTGRAKRPVSGYGFPKNNQANLATKFKGKNDKVFQRLGSCRTIANAQALNPFPDRVFTIHRYSHSQTLYTDNVTGLIGSTHQYGLNALYDPDITIVGHQPNGYDQMVAIYNRYVVYQIKILISVLFSDGQTNALCWRMQPPVNATSWVLAGRTIENIKESQNCTALDCPSQNPVQQYESPWYNIADLCGVSRTQVFTDEAFKGGYNTNPTTNCQMSIGVGSHSNETNKMIRYNITFLYKTMWTNRNELEQS